MTDARPVMPGDIITFWREAGRERWYKRDDAFDADIRRRFHETWRQATSGELSSWEATDEGLLALVIVLDQFPRNMFRDDPQMFSSDHVAREVASRAIDSGVDARTEPLLREFLYLPLMHSEHLADQERCVAHFEEAGTNPENLDYARDHADIIRRFGRFPHRNRILGRETTPEERAFLDAGGFSG